MSVQPQCLSEALITAVKSCDSAQVQDILSGIQHIPFVYAKNNESPLHIICNLENYQLSDSVSGNPPERRKLIIYMLIDAGFDTEQVDEEGNTCLFYSVKNDNAYICDILLQCGADMWAQTECKVSVLEYVNQLSSSEIRCTFSKYSPGLWKSVESEDIYQVRKLVNLWCRTDLHKNGTTLKDVALGTGNEEIITLILGIFDSMKLVYHIYAKNVQAVSDLLETNRRRVRLDLRKMSDRGAPILYYLIKSEDISIIELFIKHGCQLYSIMQDDFGYDMPVFFSALNQQVPVSVLEALLPCGKQHQEELLYKILYKGHTVLEVALRENVDIEVFKVLLDRGGPLLLCDRNQVNQTVRDLALLEGKTQYVDAIDLILLKWILNANEYPNRREKLALYGWNLKDIKEELKENELANEYFTQFQFIQSQMRLLSDSIEAGDMKMFLELKESVSIENENFLWHGRSVGDGMPLLHKAVLHNRLKMVEIILDMKPPKESIDNLFDQNRRTALHYAYASASVSEIRKLLMSYGCSEHVLDKINREPLDFRDKQDSADMTKLLDRLKSKDFNKPEVNPWDYKETSLNVNYLTVSALKDISERTNELQHSDCESEDFSELSEEGPPTKTCAII